MRERIDRFHRVDSAQSLNPALVTEIEEKTSSVKSPEARKTSEKLRNRATGWVQIGPKPVDFPVDSQQPQESDVNVAGHVAARRRLLHP